MAGPAVDKPGGGLLGAQGPQRSRLGPVRPGPGQALVQPPPLVGSEPCVLTPGTP